MIHKLRDKKRIARQKKIWQIIVAVAVFLLLVVAGLFAWSGAIFTKIGRPIWKIESVATDKIQSAGYITRTKASVFNENEVLLKQNADLNNSMIDYQILKQENDQLKEMLGRVPTNATFVLGTILTKPNRSPYDTIILDIGSVNGIKEGDQVFANAQIPVGQVSTVYSNTSLVVLYSNPSQTTDAVLNGSNASVQLIGRGGGNFEMTIPVDLSVEKGTMAVLPASTSEIIAIVEDTISAPTDPVKKVILRSPVNIQDLKWVEVKKS
jgi:rod shape-determining protein MreC